MIVNMLVLVDYDQLACTSLESWNTKANSIFA